MTLEETLRAIQPVDAAIVQEAHRRQSAMAKPLGGLGLLEETVNRIAGAQGTADVRIDKRCVVVFCADNGVVAQGVTQCGQDVTATVTENLSKGDTTVCIMARRAGVDVLPVDIGVARTVEGDKILRRKVMPGTRDMTVCPAMTREEAIQAVETGIGIALDCKSKGYQLLATGEMGIGNTTTSSAVASVLLGLEPEAVTGRGAGLSTEGLMRKINAIRQSIALHRPAASDPVDVIAKVGGLDIAGMVGLYLGGAMCNLPVVMDGFISAVAALAAVRLCPAAWDYIVPSHVSAEPAGKCMLDALHLQPLICAGMRLGEGTGAIAAISLLDLMVAVYHEMVRFDETNIEAYKPLT
ncbi:nicotinate-nucleotide--dimethylbenzimidazole phosphoribosyltransferase [Intestinibacillus massiliensis]|uniref:nicotinate-nucleotide--dimethylbenzimidazole phosphoribosyltransferase n=1 Tax=Intestinibacillus massiliensis TaxID=1871029 RepID=UPI000B35FBB7|nr:nicotinate-nucleotide--dimethylbenzimidazole phosphoribosyltransferase [Intestinibacillus massiliensis]